MCEQSEPATLESEAIVACWTTQYPWDTRYARDVLDGYEREYPKARKITLCVNGEHMAGRIKHG